MKKLMLFILLFQASMMFSQSKMYIWKAGVRTDTMDITNNLKITFGTNSSIPTDGLIAWYPFNGNLKDSSTNGNNGTAIGTITYAVGKKGLASVFSGSPNYISIPNSASLQSPTNALTIAFWVYIDSWNSNWAPIMAKSNSTAYGQYSLEINSTAGTNFWLGSNLATFNSTLTTGIWYFLAYVWDGSQAKYYLNGVFQSTKSVSGTITVENLPLEIGRHSPGGTVDYLKGKIDEMFIYSRALSEADILTLYYEGGWAGNK